MLIIARAPDLVVLWTTTTDDNLLPNLDWNVEVGASIGPPMRKFCTDSKPFPYRYKPGMQQVENCLTWNPSYQSETDDHQSRDAKAPLEVESRQLTYRNVLILPLTDM